MLIHGPIRKIIILFFVGVQVSKIFFLLIFFAGSLRNKCYFFTLEDLSSVLL